MVLCVGSGSLVWSWCVSPYGSSAPHAHIEQELNLRAVCTDVSDEESASLLYDLQSVIIHTGQYGSGHYYSYVRPDIRSDQWYRFNDNVVDAVSFSHVVADAFGGRHPGKDAEAVQKRSFWRKLLPGGSGKVFGYGGKAANAYVLQYVKRIDIPKLYGSADSLSVL